MVVRSLLEGYVKEFENIVESKRSKLGECECIDLSETKYHPIFILTHEFEIPDDLPHGDLWAQLEHHVVHMQKMMWQTASLMREYSSQLRVFANEIMSGIPIRSLKYRYGNHVRTYSLQMCSYAMTGFICGNLDTDCTSEAKTKVEQINLEEIRVNLEKWRVKFEQTRARIEQQHHQHEDEGTTTTTTATSIALPPPPPEIPYEEILDDGLLMIRKLQSIKMDSGFF